MATFGTFVDNVPLTAAELNDFLTWGTYAGNLRQGGTAVSISSRNSRYAQVNKTVFFSARIQVGSNSSTGAIEFDLPVTAATNSERVIGTAIVYDASATDIIRLVAVRSSTSRMAFYSDLSTAMGTYFGATNGPALTLAVNDWVVVNVKYQAA